MRHANSITAVALAALISAACGSTPDAVGPTDSVGKTPAPSSMAGPTWRLVSLEGKDALPGVSVTAVFEDDSRVAGSAGCNRYTGRAAVTGAQVEVGLLAVTKMYCGASGVMDQEDAYLAALAKAKAARIEGGQLLLGPAPGVVTLVFRAE